MSTMQDLLDANGIQGTHPEGWDQFIGQDTAKRMMTVAARAALVRGSRMAHVLLASGVPGLGKTTLAMLAAAEMGVQVKILSGRVPVDDARLALADLGDRDVLLLDEVHTLVQGGGRHAGWLLHLMNDGVIITAAGAEPQPDVTVIATTTDTGLLPEALLSRFQLRPMLQPYSDLEAIEIATLQGHKLLQAAGMPPLPVPSMETFMRVIRAANNNPRTIGQVLANLRDLTLVEPEIVQGAEYDIREALEWLGLEADGITSLGLRYLRVLVKDFKGGPAGQQAMVDRLQEPGGLAATERLLIDHQYIRRTRSGRVATMEGVRRAREGTR